MSAFAPPFAPPQKLEPEPTSLRVLGVARVGVLLRTMLGLGLEGVLGRLPDVMVTSPPPRQGTTDWGALLYLKLRRRLLAAGIPPFKVLPFCFSDARSWKYWLNKRRWALHPSPYGMSPMFLTQPVLGEIILVQQISDVKTDSQFLHYCARSGSQGQLGTQRQVRVATCLNRA